MVLLIPLGIGPEMSLLKNEIRVWRGVREGGKSYREVLPGLTSDHREAHPMDWLETSDPASLGAET